jgi:hypothetical protein
MGAFNQAIADLDNVADAQTAEAQRQEAIANDATRAALVAKSEAIKAAQVRLKLNEIVNPTKGDPYAPVN